MQSNKQLLHFLGLVIWGDLGDLTMYRRADGTLVWFAKTWPEKPPSDAQLTQRQLFSDAATAWHALTTYNADTGTKQPARHPSACTVTTSSSITS